MTDGERLKKLLKDNGKTWKDLGDAAGRSKAMVYQYFDMSRFAPNVRQLLIESLDKMGLDSSILKLHQAGEITDPDELRQLLGGIPDQLLPSVRRIMKASAQEKITLEALINDRLERKK